MYELLGFVNKKIKVLIILKENQLQIYGKINLSLNKK